MNFKPNPLLYGVNSDFYSSFKLGITMCDDVDHNALCRAVDGAMKRYPYFCVSPEKSGNDITLVYNSRPVLVFSDGNCRVLGSEECNGHLIFFACENNRIYINVSHYIADGMGIEPLMKTVLYLYVSEVYGTDNLQPERIKMPGDAVFEEEYSYPFPETPFETDDTWPSRKLPEAVYPLDADKFDNDGLYAYHLKVSQRAMMSKASSSDGSPVSFISVMMYRAFCSLDDKVELPVVAHVQHQYRQVLNKLSNRHSLVSYVPVTLPPRAKQWHVERQNTVLRGQIIIGTEASEDLRAVNRILDAAPQKADASLFEKKLAMCSYVDRSIEGKTFGISYVGKMDWCGLDQYVMDINVYIGEKNTKNMLLIEVMTIGEDFSLTFMQSGKGRAYLDAFIKELALMDIEVNLTSEGRYTLCDTVIPS